MKEGRTGAARLVSALHRYSEDAAALQRLAEILNYIPSQLKEDIESLAEEFDRGNKDNDKENN